MPFVVLLAVLLAAGSGASTVSVAYAGSLVHVMEGQVAQGLLHDTGLTLQGEGKGSKALAHLIGAGLREPDVFLSADTKLLEAMRAQPAPKLRGYYIFGSARMVVAYSPRSPFARAFARAAHDPGALFRLLASARVRVGRTDPQIDPKGARTITSIQLLARLERAPALATALVNRSQTFPEEDLAVRVETGELDAGFFYSTEVTGRAMRVIELPAAANLSTKIAYGIGVLSRGNTAAGHTFVNYLLGGHGRAIMQAAGVRYFTHPRVVGSP